jgi:hypothetical protein
LDPKLCYSTQDNTTDLPSLDWPGNFFDPANAYPLSQYDSTSLDLINQHHFLDTSIDGNIASPTGTFHTDASGYPRREDSKDHADSTTSTATAIRELARLNVELYEHAANIPALPTPGTTSADKATGGGGGSQKETLFAIDETFHLTKRFIDTIKGLCHAECNSTPRSLDGTKSLNGRQGMLALPSATFGQQLDHVGSTYSGPSLGPSSTSFLHADEATILMILSCYCRLTDIYGSIFKHMQACMNSPKPPVIDKGFVVVLPQLQVGSYTAPCISVDSNASLSSSTTSMYMLMTTMLSSQLYDQLAEVMRAGACSSDNDTARLDGGEKNLQAQRRKNDGTFAGQKSPSALPSSFTDKVQHTVTSRTNDLSQTIDTTRKMLQNFSVK